MLALLKTLKFIANHPLSAKQPISAYYRYGRWQIDSRLRKEVEFSWIGGAKLIARHGMTGATGNIYCGLHEFADMAFLLHLMRPGDLFTDVGANIGSYTILASAVCEANTIAVEPDPETMRALERNIKANSIEKRVKAVQMALGAETGTARFTVGCDTVNRVVTNGTSNTREVEMIRLDDLLAGADPIFIKLDVEGFEANVLAGARDTLRNPYLLAIATESTDNGVVSYLEQAEFKQWSYDPFKRQLTPNGDGQAAVKSANALFIRDAATCRKRTQARRVWRNDLIHHPTQVNAD